MGFGRETASDQRNAKRHPLVILWRTKGRAFRDFEIADRYEYAGSRLRAVAEARRVALRFWALSPVGTFSTSAATSTSLSGPEV